MDSTLVAAVVVAGAAVFTGAAVVVVGTTVVAGAVVVVVGAVVDLLTILNAVASRPFEVFTHPVLK